MLVGVKVAGCKVDVCGAGSVLGEVQENIDTSTRKKTPDLSLIPPIVLNNVCQAAGHDDSTGISLPLAISC